MHSRTLHAEMNAILSYRSKKKNLKMPKTLIVVGYYKGRLHNSRPCDHCLALLKYYDIKKVIYSTGDAEVFRTEKIKNMEYFRKSSGNQLLSSII